MLDPPRRESNTSNTKNQRIPNENVGRRHVMLLLMVGARNDGWLQIHP